MKSDSESSHLLKTPDMGKPQEVKSPPDRSELSFLYLILCVCVCP